MKVVLIIGPNYFNFLNATESAFRENGWDVCICGYETPINPYGPLRKVIWKFSRNRKELLDKSRKSFSAKAIETFDKVRPELVFILNGEMLEAEIIEHFKTAGAKTALWLFDNRVKLPFADSLAVRVDALFCFDKNDADSYIREGVKAHFLPQACDTSVYHPLPAVKTDIDILFVGNLFYSKKRKQLTQKVIESFPESKVEIYGLYQPWFKGLWKWLNRPYKSVYKNRNVRPEEVNLLYNRAKLVLNIHQESQTDGANPRVFEICGAGAFQICDKNPYLSSLFKDGEVALYSTEDELIEQISTHLNKDNARAALSAKDYVCKNHSFTSRIREVFEILSCA